MKLKLTAALITATALTLAAMWILNSRAESGRFIDAMTRVGRTVAALPPIPEAPAAARPLDAGTPERAALFAVRGAYDRIRLEQNPRAEDLKQLEAIAGGLTSANPVVRATTEDIIRHLLTSWVRSRSAAEWHRSPEVDSFFHAFLAAKPRALERFIKLDAGGPESLYVTQISQENI